MKAERNDFNVDARRHDLLGQRGAGPPEPDRAERGAKWAKYRVNLGNRSLQALRASAGFYSHWDDHEFVNDFSPAENRSTTA